MKKPRYLERETDMRQIRDTSILEIDITNACVHNCSNCSRFCGHHKKTYFMDFETFRRAVDSLTGYEGLVSLIGVSRCSIRNMQGLPDTCEKFAERGRIC